MDSHRRTNLERMFELAGAVCDETATPEDAALLDSMLAADPSLRREYWDYCRIHITFGTESRVHRALQRVRYDVADSSALAPWESEALKDAVLPFVDHSPLAPVAAPLWQGALAGLSSGWPAAYLIATVIFGIGLTIAAITYVSRPSQQERVAGESPDSQSALVASSQAVGRITGMVDCRWEGAGGRGQGTGDRGQGTGDRGQRIGDRGQGIGDRGQGIGDRGQGAVVSGQNSPGHSTLPTTHYPLPTTHYPLSTIHYPLSTVSLGDTFALKSGLLEITYDTGARVILQGPVTYKVDSVAGGYLSVGKLTAKLEKRGVGRGTGDGEAVNRPSSSGHQPLATSHSPLSTASDPSSLSPLPSPLFAVRTPTAIVTDLGTEFGVEVDERGATVSHVFRGVVTVQAIARGGEPQGAERTLRANESARVQGPPEAPTIVVVRADVSADFIQSIPRPTAKVFDLADVVAGGNGFSGRRGRGLDSTNGRTTRAPLKVELEGKESYDVADYLVGDGQYHCVDASPFVDGVFIPNGRLGPVRISSAGDVFAGFPDTSSQTGAHIWSGGPIAFPLVSSRTELGGIDYALPGHGLLYLHANNGITFDLEAIRRATSSFGRARFRAAAGNVEISSKKGLPVSADLWVLVDGRVRFKWREINSYSGAIPVNVPIARNDRFLTLAATDGNNGIEMDWIMFGDPRLELAPTEEAVGSDVDRKEVP